MNLNYFMIKIMQQFQPTAGSKHGVSNVAGKVLLCDLTITESG